MFNDFLGPVLDISLLLQLEKGNLPWWCLIMVSSKLMVLLLSFLIFVCLCFKLLFKWFKYVHVFSETSFQWTNMPLTLTTLIPWRHIRKHVIFILLVEKNL